MFLDEVKSISISALKKWGYLKKDGFKSGTLTWSRFGEVHSSIGIKLNYFYEPYLEVDYTWRDQSINYRVNLVSVPSNLGKGDVFYFLCPKTLKRCSKLYFNGGYFVHREATGLIYSQQAYSKKDRALVRIFNHINTEPLFEELYSKGFTKYYNGKPTKRYQRILDRLAESESYSSDTYFRIMRGEV